MNGDILKLAENIGGSLLLALFGYLFRTIRRYLNGLKYAQEDISTIWVHLELPRHLRSGSYSRPRYKEEDE